MNDFKIRSAIRHLYVGFKQEDIYRLIAKLVRSLYNGISAGFSRKDVLDMTMDEANFHIDDMNKYLESVKKALNSKKK